MSENRTIDREQLYADLRESAAAPLWTVLSSLVSSEPNLGSQPHAWHFEDMLPLLDRSGEVISAAEAERRVLMLENPAYPGEARITEMLYAGLQLLLPGETAPCHRHSQSALRFVLEGGGAHTAVDGEKVHMNPFDLVLTPAGRWHDHGNEGNETVIWLDGLDIPIVTAFGASFAESFADGPAYPNAQPAGTSHAIFGENMRPLLQAEHAGRDYRSLFHYPYDRWRAALEAFSRDSDCDPRQGFAMEFIDPQTGGDVLRTISAGVRLLRCGFATASYRTTESQVFVGVEGHGSIHVGERQFDIGPRDIVAVPGWTERGIAAESDLVLFDFSDRAAQRKLGLWREETVGGEASL
ncbi:cupin domain-containing protein [Parasphingopyxis algicola]|uniref:cupin domain-containing protein n=1 Tax=Parasphingopyxis algicola TaxID=2026624 RepID=UPI0015A1D059|nr:cupin domain-containing protein [Parasphingopyxis algicola]QLC23916.1 cupin domain-containing protein [Parasphingopyxis algicola]